MRPPPSRERGNPPTGHAIDILVASLSSPPERAALVLGTRNTARIAFCVNALQVASAAADPAAVAVVFEVFPDSKHDICTIAAAIARRDAPIPLLLRVGLRGVRALPLSELQHVLFDLRLSLRNADHFARCVAGIRFPTTQARIAILARIQELVPPEVLDIVVAATVLGERHASMSVLAALCELSERRLEERLAEVRTLPGKRLMMWMLSLHSMWRLERLGWPAKRAASEAGFATPDGLSRLVQRTVGLRLVKLVRGSSFDGTLDLFCLAMSTPAVKSRVHV